MKLALSVAAATTLAVPALARPVTFEAKLKNYGGNGAYVVMYVTDVAGKYRGTLWMAGGKAKYYRHLSDWQRASTGALAEIDGITGASIGSGKTLKVTVDLADALIDAGYQIHVDTAVEDGLDQPSEVVVPLSTGASGQAAPGKAHVKTFTVTF
ncbi:DUF2271 domain-containing protein [Methylobacterium nodulans]|uniref:Tat (Twin-arginine translocation) pathway signal sequence domain protein n=1 Tax=Methylobacterium nodulans (strain LMG 21967 / CNCM I-2342 / ORS 2060) TaxID=460265 RepID=B8IJI7_METNO|nr:DUF2271 domain-containing protein [Methylobacterium nodulans]ACL58035.1 conserved hypothetical protein [Methylobacterium nodulans ORS 2060]